MVALPRPTGRGCGLLGVTPGRGTTTRDRIDAWARTVRWVEEHPADFLHQEYENALNGRNWIEIALMGEHLAPGLEAEVARLDDRFRRTTRESPRVFCLLPGDQPPGWWWFRIPSTVEPAFVAMMNDEVPGLAAELGLGAPPQASDLPGG